MLAGGLSAAPHRQYQEQIEESIQLKCHLCLRNRPVFAGDDDMKRLPETAMSKFLKVLRHDTVKKHRYL